MSHYQGPTQPHTPLKVAEPGTPEHAHWKRLQQERQAAYEARFAATAHLRPGYWGKG